MFKTGIDILRAAIAGAIFFYLRSMHGKGHFRFGKGGELGKYFIIGKTNNTRLRLRLEVKPNQTSRVKKEILRLIYSDINHSKWCHSRPVSSAG